MEKIGKRSPCKMAVCSFTMNILENSRPLKTTKYNHLTLRRTQRVSDECVHQWMEWTGLLQAQF